MGKVKRKKNKTQRANPIGNGGSSSLAQFDEEVHDNGVDTDISPYVQAILEQLQSHSVEERDCGLNTLSSACQDPSLLDQFLKHDVVKFCKDFLTDKSPIVRHSAAGALRNISTVGSAVCSMMISQGIMPPLVALLKQNYSTWKPQHPSSPIGSRIDTVLETFIEAVNLLWNLCESSSTAVKCFNEEELGELLIRCMNTNEYGIRVSIAIGQCLNTVTEDNKDAIPNIGEFENLLQKILISESDTSENGTSHPSFSDCLYLQMLASGILLNLKEGGSRLSLTNISLTMKAIGEILSIDHLQILNTFTSEIPLPICQNTMETNHSYRRIGSEGTVEQIHALEMASSKISNLLNGQMLALEILSNILFSDAEDDDGDFCDNDSDDDDTVDSKMDEDETMDDVSFTAIVPEVYEAITNMRLLHSVINKIREPPVNVTNILNDGPEYGRCVGRCVRSLRCRALLCFQNLIDGLDANDLGEFENMKDMWAILNRFLKQEAVNEDLSESDLVEAISSAMRALALKWTDDNDKYSEIMGCISTSDLNVYCTVYNRVTVAKIHANIIKIIGAMGILLAVKEKGSQLPAAEIEIQLEQIGEFLLSCISSYGNSQHLWRVSEALDTIFDVFAEDDYNHVLKKLGMIEKLKIFLPQFKKNIRNERRHLGENKAIIDTSSINLRRFIDYKIKNDCA